MAKLPFEINMKARQTGLRDRVQRFVSQATVEQKSADPAPTRPAPKFGKTTNEAKGYSTFAKRN